MLAMNYRTVDPVATGQAQGRVSRYAWGGADYHDVIRSRLNELGRFLQRLAPAARVRGVVDTAPFLEREFAQLAGLGWIGKNTLLLNRENGSWFFLAALLTDVELEYDAAHETDHCGTCRACLEACPTGAFPQPYVLDASRCISYLTIELRGAVPTELRAGMGEWAFGCDICQDVCPWNSHTNRTIGASGNHVGEFQPRADTNPLHLIPLFTMDDAAFRKRFRHTPLWRPKRRGLLRNAAIVLGNRPAPAALAALVAGLNDCESIVRGACAWALGNYPQSAARAALEERRVVETEAAVIAEIDAALAAAVDQDAVAG
jgi:epoxyqueuosine reductase